MDTEQLGKKTQVDKQYVACLNNMEQFLVWELFLKLALGETINRAQPKFTVVAFLGGWGGVLSQRAKTG